MNKWSTAVKRAHYTLDVHDVLKRIGDIQKNVDYSQVMSCEEREGFNGAVEEIIQAHGWNQ